MINIAELLKDVPEGTELWCTVYGKVKFISVNFKRLYPIKIKLSDTSIEELDVYGRCYNYFEDAECVLFPSKEVRTWEGWKLPVEPKFKVGDSLQSGSYWARIKRIDAENRRYICDFDNVIPFEKQELWSLVPNSKPHYDIANFHTGMPVLVRNGNCHEWRYVTFSHYRKVGTPFCAGGQYWYQCIPFGEGTKHLLGTTDMCPEEFINW